MKKVTFLILIVAWATNLKAQPAGKSMLSYKALNNSAYQYFIPKSTEDIIGKSAFKPLTLEAIKSTAILDVAAGINFSYDKMPVVNLPVTDNMPIAKLYIPENMPNGFQLWNTQADKFLYPLFMSTSFIIVIVSSP